MASVRSYSITFRTSSNNVTRLYGDKHIGFLLKNGLIRIKPLANLQWVNFHKRSTSGAYVPVILGD